MILHFVKHRKVAGSAGLSEAQDLPDEGESPEEIVLADKRKRAVNDAVEKLPAEMRAAVRFVYFAEMTYDEAAKVLGKSRKQVDNLLYRAKKELHDILGREP